MDKNPRNQFILLSEIHAKKDFSQNFSPKIDRICLKKTSFLARDSYNLKEFSAREPLTTMIEKFFSRRGV